MEKEFVSYEQAVALKELGFDEEVFQRFTLPNMDDFCKHPLKQQVFRWFREKYQLEGIPQRSDDWLWYKFVIYKLYKDCKLMVSAKVEFKIYEEAENACIDKLIQLAKQQDK